MEYLVLLYALDACVSTILEYPSFPGQDILIDLAPKLARQPQERRVWLRAPNTDQS